MIADSSVLIVFARAQRLELLYHTVGAVGVTREVRGEAVGAAPHRPDAVAIARALEGRHLFEVRAAPARIRAVLRRYPNLGRGEASVIVAALQRREATVLMDERAARRAAALEGLQPVGCLGVLARARRRGVLASPEEVAAALRAVVSAGLWVTPEVVEAFWEALGERR